VVARFIRAERWDKSKKFRVDALRASIYTTTGWLTPQPPPGDDLEVRQTPTSPSRALTPLEGMTSEMGITEQDCTKTRLPRQVGSSHPRQDVLK